MSVQVFTENRFSDIGRLKGWLPVDAVIRDGRPAICWLDMRDVALSEPFFFQTVERVRREQRNIGERITDYDVLIQSEKLLVGLNPSAFIFHSSRSGSTVVSNALKVLERVLVFSEPFVLDKLIGRFFTDVKHDKRRELVYGISLRAAVNALGQPRYGNERAYFIKFSSVSTAQISRIKRIWPHVPSVFIYRDPIEVIVSNLNDPPHWMDRKADARITAQLTGVGEDEVAELSREEFCARAIGGFYRSALSAGETLRLLNYEDLSVDSIVGLIEAFGLRLSASEHQPLTEIIRYYAKDAGSKQEFRKDTERKRQQASKLVREMAERWAINAYSQLEQKRIEQQLQNKKERGNE